MQQTNNSSKITKKVIFDHDGGIDDLLSLLLLLTFKDIEVVGVTITPADCYPDDALTSTLKILALTNNQHIPVAVGNLAGLNPFPPEWRAQPKFCHALPMMLRERESRQNVVHQPAHLWMKDYLAKVSEKISVLMTGPATNLAQIIRDFPECVEKLEKVIWMGGALKVKGNVAMHDSDGSQEWNAYWDPFATKTLVESKTNLCLVPLDVTNALPIDRAFLAKLAESQGQLAQLAGQFWAATTTSIPTYEFTYFMWDVLATAILGLADCHWNESTARVQVSVESPKAGTIRMSHDNEGHQIKWVSKVDADYVRQFVIKQFDCNFDAFFTDKC